MSRTGRWATAPAGPARERATARAGMFLASAVMVILVSATTPLEGTGTAPAVAWAAAVAAVGGLSLLPPLWRVLDRVGSVLTIALIALLVWTTGGIDSPFGILYLFHGVFAAVYVRRERLVAEILLAVAVFWLPALYDTLEPAEVGLIVMATAVYVAMVGFLHLLVQRLRQTRRDLSAAQQRYRSAFDSTPQPAFIVDEHGLIADVNTALVEWIGLARNDLIGTRMLDFAVPEEVEDARATFARVLAGETARTRRTVVDAHGRRRQLISVSRPHSLGDRPAVYVVVQDTTGIESPVAALRASEERYRSLIEHLPAVVYLASPGYYRASEPLWFVSGLVEDLLGYPQAAWLSDPSMWRTAVHPDDQERVRLTNAAARREGAPYRLEYRLVTADGSVRWVMDQAHPVTGPEDQDGWVQGVILDITARKRDEAELEATRAQALEDAARLQGLIDASPLPIAELDVDGCVRVWNAAAHQALGIAPGDAVGEPLATLVPALGPHVVDLLAAGSAGPGIGPREITLEHPDGHEMTMLLHASGHRTGPDEVRTVIFLVDITQQRALESHLHEASKMEALGRLVGSVAHDVNNLLTVIGAYAELAARNEAGGDGLMTAIEGIRAAVEDGAQLVDSFLGVARTDETTPQVVSLRDVLEDDRTFYAWSLPDGVRLDLRLPDGPTPVRLVPVHLRRILLNLLLNAADAMPDGGTVRVSCAATAGTVELAVQDEGVGIAASDRTRMFEPFFTTKAGRRGTGLGLFAVYQLVQRYGGRLKVESALGHGTTMIVVLPRAAEAAASADRPRG